MKTYERAIYDVAKLYLRDYGGSAVNQASERARTLGEAGDLQGHAT